MTYFRSRLGHRRYRAVDHVDRAQDEENDRPRLHPLRQQGHAHTDDAERAQFHQHAGVQHAHGSRGRDVAVRRPRVERPEARQQAEADHHEREQRLLRTGRQSAVLHRVTQLEDVEGAYVHPDVDGDDGYPDEHALAATIISTSFSAPYSFVRAKNSNLELEPQTAMRRNIGTMASS